MFASADRAILSDNMRTLPPKCCCPSTDCRRTHVVGELCPPAYQCHQTIRRERIHFVMSRGRLLGSQNKRNQVPEIVKYLETLRFS